MYVAFCHGGKTRAIFLTQAKIIGDFLRLTSLQYKNLPCLKTHANDTHKQTSHDDDDNRKREREREREF